MFRRWLSKSQNPVVNAIHELQKLFKEGASGTFQTSDGKTVVVEHGLIKEIKDA